tara:strand:- start:192 stop:338 length:147 start_codon:yes stop_codon:yes gene_type:complete
MGRAVSRRIEKVLAYCKEWLLAQGKYGKMAWVAVAALVAVITDGCESP